MTLPYSCLILDHDDTAVDSTAAIHHPAHIETMRVLRPGRRPVELEEWWAKNFDPGVMEYLTGELGFTEEEIQEEYRIWREFTVSRSAPFFPGFIEALIEYKDRGGKIAVVSHSDGDLIERDYRRARPEGELIPDLIYGWDFDPEKRKPSPRPVEEILRTFGLTPEEALIVDDLKPGLIMAERTGVAFAAAGWSHDIPKIRDYMQARSRVYFSTVEDFRRYILGEK